MDCRRAWWLALVLITGGAGCIQSDGQKAPDNRREVDAAGGAPISKKSSANLFLAQARLFERNAAVPDAPAQYQQSVREQARQAYRQALELDPKNVEPLLALGRLADIEGDQDHAKQYLTRAT